LPVGDHEVLVRFESIQVVQNLVINNVLDWRPSKLSRSVSIRTERGRRVSTSLPKNHTQT